MHKFVVSLVITFLLLTTIPSNFHVVHATENIVLLSSDNKADLCVSYTISNKLGYPLVVTSWGEYDSEIEEIILSLHPSKVIIIGGEKAVLVEYRRFLDRVGIGYVVIGGKTREETSLKAYEFFNERLDILPVLVDGTKPVVYEGMFPINVFSLSDDFVKFLKTEKYYAVESSRVLNALHLGYGTPISIIPKAKVLDSFEKTEVILRNLREEISLKEYFPTEPGYYVKYHMIDPTWHSLNNYVEVVAQYPPRGDFFFTFTDIEGNGYFSDSAIMGKIDDHIYFFSGCPVGEQVQYWFRLLYLPLKARHGEVWSKGPTVYHLEFVGDTKIGSVSCDECIKITIDNTRSINKYLRGRGIMYLSKGIGIVKYEFWRSDGGHFQALAVESGKLKPKTVSGVLTLDGITPAWKYRVQLAFCGGEESSVGITNFTGRFALEAFFDKGIVLRYGPALDENQLDIEESRETKVFNTNVYLTMGLPLSDEVFEELRSTEEWKRNVYELHKKAWFRIASNASKKPEFKYAIYQSRSLAVKHPEVYLKADALFNELLTSQPNMWDYYMDRTQDLLKQKEEYKKIESSNGENFSWSKFDITRHKPLGYEDLYDTVAFLPFVDIRLHFMGSSLKGSNWQATPLSMAEFLYFKLKSENKEPYLVVTSNGTAFVAYKVGADYRLIDFMGNSINVPPSNVILVFNENYVWYPLMGRDDTSKDTNLRAIVGKYTTPNNLPNLTSDEKELVNILKESTELYTEQDYYWAVYFAGKLHIRSWEYYPKVFKVLYPEDAERGGFHVSHGPSTITARNAYIARISGQLSPSTAMLASLARMFSNYSLDTMISVTFGKYLDYVATNENPRQGGLTLWFHSELFFLNIDDSFLTRGGNCVMMATYAASILDLAEIPGLEVYIVGMKYTERQGGHAYTVVFRGNEKGIIENLRWTPNVNGLENEKDGAALDMIITSNGWVVMDQYPPFKDGKVRTTFEFDELTRLFDHLTYLGPETHIAEFTGEGWKINRVPIQEFIQEKLKQENILPYPF
ncbi:MAG TPA: hypothetical protein ENF20_01045 [Candidatus Marinimicrobia bacterium]|nr:hypothetical protein [Candidatus Neomarinimicrobiota bacterium]